jgi:hypothetical protein
MNGDSRGIDPGHRPAVDPSTTDSQRLAREQARARLAERNRRRAICREAERLMPLVRCYGPRPLLAVPIGCYYVRGRWAA